MSKHNGSMVKGLGRPNAGGLVLLDEPSIGLAPQIVDEIFAIVRELNDKEGVSFLIAEQNTAIALRAADYYPYRVVYIRFIGTHAQYDRIDAQNV